LGDEETVSSLDRDRIHEFWAEQYRPGNVVFAAAGRLDHDRMVDAVAAGAGAMVGGAAPRRTAPVAPAERFAVVEQDTEQAHLVVGVRALDRDHADRHTLAVLEHALGGGLSSRLWQSVREERGLAYSIYSFRNGYQGTGSLGVYAGTGPEHLGEVLDLVVTAFEGLAAAGITQRELEVAQGHLVGEMALSLEDSAARMSRIGRSLLVHGRVVPTVDYEASIRAVTVEDVRRVAAEVLSGPRSVAVVGPVTESAVQGAA
jgi:predicted Zn-dependent peptidase